MSTPRKRNEDGLDYKRPIALRLMLEEREEAEVLSSKFNKTKSAFARLAYLAGVKVLTASSPAAVAAASVASGADSIVGTADFSSSSMGK
ncbi:hypothetical protein C3Y98_05195 [Methylotenera oryzisoli]|uniref:Uncharacterized protein n=1 Tax=Methylotenera oryzisoli TaxID=2080758 RepID=A0A4Y9VRA8_9PROT|nr:hypothetical protein [Methylotenera oryzisoli]TFW71494.1 hypothetical protein C3Y98_05195 [Methylotenera oryzisoli]